MLIYTLPRRVYIGDYFCLHLLFCFFSSPLHKYIFSILFLRFFSYFGSFILAILTLFSAFFFVTFQTFINICFLFIVVFVVYSSFQFFPNYCLIVGTTNTVTRNNLLSFFSLFFFAIEYAVGWCSYCCCWCWLLL